jgi:hypothetical protein
MTRGARAVWLPEARGTPAAERPPRVAELAARVAALLIRHGYTDAADGHEILAGVDRLQVGVEHE